MKRSVLSDKELYQSVKAEADKTFTSKTGIYKSSWIVREYKKRGGTYKEAPFKSVNAGLLRWYREKWVDLNRPIYNSIGRVIGYEQCGRPVASQKGLYPLCRPLKRVTPQTPLTVKELTKASIRQANIDKQQVRHKGNVNWGRGPTLRGPALPFNPLRVSLQVGGVEGEPRFPSY